MDLQFFQSWRYNRETGFKAWFGFLAVTDTEIITFTSRAKHGEHLVRASPDRPHHTVARQVQSLLASNNAKKVKRFARSDVVAVSAVPNAKRLTITTADGAQHAVKEFPFPEELTRLAALTGAALFESPTGVERTIKATGSGMSAPTLAPLGIGLLLGVLLIGAKLLDDGSEPSIRRRWFVELLQDTSTGVILAIGIALIAGGIALSMYRMGRGYKIIEWLPGDGLGS